MECGHPLGEASGPTSGERRQLTVVFCDLVGSTELAQRLDVEQLRELITGYQRTCVASIERLSGHVAQYLGDGILAYFGYPVAAEDDVERALRAALDMLLAMQRASPRRFGPRLNVRIGIHTGPVVVSDIGGGARRETLALGATANFAARLQGLAAPGTIVASEATLSHVPGLFVTSDLGRHALKGIEGPVRVHRVDALAGLRHRLDAAVLTPLVGRTVEMQTLMDCWRQTTTGRGRVVLLSGDAGIGKSRLIRAFHERLAAEPHTTLDGYCAPRTAGSAFEPLIGLIARGFALADDDTPSQRLSRIETTLDLPDIELSRIVPPLARLLSLPPSRQFAQEEIAPEFERERTLTALTDTVLAFATRQPVLITLEDLHWSDPSTLEFLQRLLPRLAEVPVVIIVTARPTFHPPWLSAADTIRLAPLAADEIRDLALATMGAKLPQEVVDQIVARSDGIPLFAEELTRAVDLHRHADAGDGDVLAVPATLQDSLMARLDRLGNVKRVAQLCATLGREFAYTTVEAVADDPGTLRNALDRLVGADILQQQGAAPRTTYTFRHALLQDIAYHSQLDADREKIHARIARFLENEFAGTTPETVAEHYREGGLIREAARYYRRAGEHALDRWANVEAVASFRRAMALEADTGATVQRRLQTMIKLGEALVRCGRRVEASEIYLQGLGMDAAYDFELRRGAGYNLLRAGRVVEGLRQLEALCREVGLGWPRGVMASFLAVVGLRFKVARRNYQQRVSSHTAEAPAVPRRMDLCLDLGLALRLVAPLHSAIFASRYTILALESGDPARVARALALEAGTNAVAGSRRGPLADTLVARADAIAAEVGDPHLVAFVRILAANVSYQEGAWERTRVLCEEAESLLREVGGAAAEHDILSLQLNQALYFRGDLGTLRARLAQDDREVLRGDTGGIEHHIAFNQIARMLYAGDPDEARARASAARAQLATDRFGFSDLMATHVVAESLLYERRGAEAARLIRDSWGGIRGTFVLLAQLGAVVVWDLVGRCELSAAAGGDSGAVRRTRSAIRRLEGLRCGWGAALAASLQAGLASVTGQSVTVRAALSHAADQLEAAELGAYADAARYRLFRLTTDTHKAAEDVTARWVARGVIDPGRMFDMLLPGAWHPSPGETHS